MDITIYLPDELALRAKSAGVNLSRLLRDALIEQFHQEDAVANATQDATIVTLDLQDRDGRAYKGRITASRIAQTDRVEVYLTPEEKVVVYDLDQLRYDVVEDPEEELVDLLRDDDYLEVMNALGIVPTVDLDL